MADTPENVADTTNTGGSEDVVVTDRQLYDHAISDAKPEPAAPAVAEADKPLLQPTQQEPAAAQRVRDDQGRFVPKQAQQPTQQPTAAPQQPQRTPEDHRVPLRELLDERERRQKIEAEAQQLRQAWAQIQQAQQEAAAQQQPQTIFDNPDQYLVERVINPLRQEGQRYMLQIKDGMSRTMADQQFGAQVVGQALQDLTTIRYTPHGDYLFHQIMADAHPYGALVKWHQQARAQQRIGPDPEAWFNNRAEQLLNDPRWQAEAIKRYQQQQQKTGRPPNVSLPPSLSSVPASSSRIEEQGDMSNDSLYRFATR